MASAVWVEDTLAFMSRLLTLQPGDHAVRQRAAELAAKLGRTTEALAAWLSERRRHGRTVLVVGSDLGLDEGVKSAARELLALSRLTLPHQLARLVLLEQLYRACDLLAGGQYHRGDMG